MKKSGKNPFIGLSFLILATLLLNQQKKKVIVL